MAQFDAPDIDPQVDDGTYLTSWLHSLRDALRSIEAGTSRPSYAQAGVPLLWLNTTAGANYELMLWDGDADLRIKTINATGNDPRGSGVIQQDPQPAGAVRGDLWWAPTAGTLKVWNGTIWEDVVSPPVDLTPYYLLDGSRSLTGPMNANGNAILSVSGIIGATAGTVLGNCRIESAPMGSMPTSYVQIRGTADPALAVDNPLIHGELAVNTATRQLWIGDLDAQSGAPILLTPVREYNQASGYATNDHVIVGGALQKSKAILAPGTPYDLNDWDLYLPKSQSDNIYLAINGGTHFGDLLCRATGAGQTPLTVQGAPTQSGDLFRVERNDSSLIAHVDDSEEALTGSPILRTRDTAAAGGGTPLTRAKLELKRQEDAAGYGIERRQTATQHGALEFVYVPTGTLPDAKTVAGSHDSNGFGWFWNDAIYINPQIDNGRVPLTVWQVAGGAANAVRILDSGLSDVAFIRSDGSAQFNGEDIGVPSSRAFKRAIRELSGVSAMDLLRRLKPSRYERIATEREEYGFIVEDVEAEAPELVTERGTLKSRELIPLIVSALQSIGDALAELRSDVDALKADAAT